jgi:ferrochelatase
MTSTVATGLGGRSLDPYDAVLLVSFGVLTPADVMPFLENVTRGRGIPPERLVEVAEHYYHFGGRARSTTSAAACSLPCGPSSPAGIGVPLTWGNRNWKPYLADTVAALSANGHRRVLALTTSAHPSYSSCRQYREDLRRGG